MTTHYDTLEISPSATIEEIRKAYHRLAMKWHPDKNPAPDAEEKFKAINRANEILSDPQRKERYDKLIGNLDSNPEDILELTDEATLPLFELHHPGLLATLNAKNFLKVIQESNLSSEEIRFLWNNIIKDHSGVFNIMPREMNNISIDTVVSVLKIMPRDSFYYASLLNFFRFHQYFIENTADKASYGAFLNIFFERPFPVIKYTTDYLFQVRRFFRLAANLNPEVRTKFLAWVEEIEKESPKPYLELLISAACMRETPEEKECAMRAMPIPSISPMYQKMELDHQGGLLRDWFPPISESDAYIFANVYIKHPNIVNFVINGSFIPSQYIPEKYKEIFKSVESEVMAQNKKEVGEVKGDRQVQLSTNRHALMTHSRADKDYPVVVSDATSSCSIS